MYWYIIRPLLIYFSHDYIGLIQKLRNRERERERQRSVLQRQRSRERETRRTLSYDAPPFYMPSDVPGSSVDPASSDSNPAPPAQSSDEMLPPRRQLGERLYPKVHALQPVSHQL